LFDLYKERKYKNLIKKTWMVRNERGRGVGMNDRKKQKKMIQQFFRWGSYLSYFKSYDTLSKSIEEIEMVAIKKRIIVFVENWPWDN